MPLLVTGSYRQGFARSRGGVVHRSCFRLYLVVLPLASLLACFVGGVRAGSIADAKSHQNRSPISPKRRQRPVGQILADYIRRTEGITAVVENRAGAGSVIGTDAISHAAPDGATLLINTPNIVIAAHLRKLDYDPLTSFSAGIGSLLISANSILNTARFQQAHIRGE